MASFSRHLLLSLILCSILFINRTAKCEEDEEDTLLQGINRYRASLNLSALTENDKAECLADELADLFKDQPCTNSTGANTVPGTELQFANYPQLLGKCDLNVTNRRRHGVILPACVPNLVPTLVLSNYTMSHYSQYLDDSKFTGIGFGAEDNWTVVVLTANSPEGSFADRATDGEDDHQDEEDSLLLGINSFRGSLNLNALTENEKAECLADEIADQLQDQPCTTAAGAYTPDSPQFSNYRGLLAKCDLDVTSIRAGVILPTCVPDLVPAQVLSNYTAPSQYSQYIKDTKFTGIGIGTEDKWVVVVLSTNTPQGNFISAKSLGNVNLAEKLGPMLSHFMPLLIALFVVLLL